MAQVNNGLDAHSISVVTPSFIRVLVLPVGPISEAKFKKYSRHVCRFSNVYLCDVPPEASGAPLGT